MKNDAEKREMKRERERERERENGKKLKERVPSGAAETVHARHHGEHESARKKTIIRMELVGL